MKQWFDHKKCATIAKAATVAQKTSATVSVANNPLLVSHKEYSVFCTEKEKIKFN
jgi:hypothetical protein